MAKKEIKTKKEVKSNKENKHFWKNFKAELKKVTWPTPKQLFNSTSVVIAIVLMVALIVFILDICFDSVNKYGITKLQTMIQNSTSVEENVSGQATDENSEESNTEEVTQNTEVTEEQTTETAPVENEEKNNQENTQSNE